MALVQCKECGKEISDKAFSCPSCGCPVGLVEPPPATPSQTENIEDRLWGKQKFRKSKGAWGWKTAVLCIAVMIAIVWVTGIPGVVWEMLSSLRDRVSTSSDQADSDRADEGVSTRGTPIDTLGIADYNEAVRLLGAGNETSNSLAEQKLKVSLLKNPSCGEAHLNLGLIYMNKGWSDGAESETNEAIDLLQRTGKTIIVGSTLRQTLALAYNNLGVIEMRRILEAGEAQTRVSAKGLWLKGMGYFQTAISFDPECSTAQANIARYKDIF